MKVKSTSWHYRFNVWRTNEWKTKRKNSLCSYFWFTVGNIVFCTMIAAILLVVFYGMGFAMNDEFIKHGFNALNLPFYSGHLVVFLMGVLIIAIIAAVIFSLFAAGHYGKKGMVCAIHSIHKPHSGTKENGLLISWIKAKKEKVCPVIEFER